MIKICTNVQHCSEVAHNVEKKETHCRNCDYVMLRIDEPTYWKKFAGEFFQYDYGQSGHVF